jgi:hypothetical protein
MLSSVQQYRFASHIIAEALTAPLSSAVRFLCVIIMAENSQPEQLAHRELRK